MSVTATDARLMPLLKEFGKRVDGRLSAGELAKRLGKQESLDATEADRALATLIEEGLLTAGGGAKEGTHPRKNASYRLTDKGRGRLRPSKPAEIPDELLRHQEAFILLQLFRANEMTRSKLNEKLRTKAAMGQLEFDVAEAPETIEYHLTSLIENGFLVEQKSGNSAKYTLDQELGIAALASARQYDQIELKMNGATLNRLLAAARLSSPTTAAAGATPQAETRVEESEPLGPRDIKRHIDRLRSDRFAGKDLIPVHALRGLVAEHHGEEAASHPAFDPLIKRMRADGELRLIAIADNRDATQEQLDASIPGMNETLFYIVVQ